MAFNANQLQEGRRQATYRTYNDVFKKDFDLRFGLPAQDTCNYCAEKKAAIKLCHNPEEKAMLEEELALHHDHAVTARRTWEADGQNNDDRICSLTSDLEKILFVPHLTCSSHFFKRKLSTFNLRIHKTGSGDAAMYMWNEVIAEHSSKDIISCLWHYITDNCEELVGKETRKFILWSDRATGQFNNSFMLLFLKYLVDMRYFTSCEHKMFVTGHSWMTCDADFGLVEKRFNALSPIVIARQENPFKLHKMKQEEFFDFNILKDYVDLPESLQVTKYHHFKIEKRRPMTILAKKYHSSVEWKAFKLINIKEAGLNSIGQLPNAYDGPLELEEGKARDLRNLMLKIADREKREYYERLTSFLV